jgi:hypothetical protein
LVDRSLVDATCLVAEAASTEKDALERAVASYDGLFDSVT